MIVHSGALTCLSLYPISHLPSAPFKRINLESRRSAVWWEDTSLVASWIWAWLPAWHFLALCPWTTLSNALGISTFSLVWVSANNLITQFPDFATIPSPLLTFLPTAPELFSHALITIFTDTSKDFSSPFTRPSQPSQISYAHWMDPSCCPHKDRSEDSQTLRIGFL